ncbi:uncharacterized protein [Pocillopora verrucosa]|uniref:uncharacterized protein n=1 Tax=Pocillopora verrucosa TaxID=203993 RepID=UPI00333F1AB4
MGLSPAFVACLILFSCMSHIQASVLNFAVQKGLHGSQKFKLSIMERETRFYEEVEINEDEQFAHFHVPPHNGLAETDELFDFQMNVAVRRLKGACYVQPMQEDFPKLNALKTGFKKAVNQPPNHKISTISKYWVIGDKVDETSLRRVVREFCDQHPVYRLEEHISDSVSVARERRRRQVTIGLGLARNFTVCDENAIDRVVAQCPPNDWTWKCTINLGNCIYFFTCELAIRKRTVDCTMIKHEYDSIVCCNPSCKTGN